MDGTGINGTIAYMQTQPVGQILQELRRTEGVLESDGLGDGEQEVRGAQPMPASGKGQSLADALGSSCGEFVERYAATREMMRARRRGAIRLASARALRREGYRVVGADVFQFFAPAQYSAPGFPFVPFSDDVPVGWVEVQEVGSGPAWIPAVLVFMGYREAEGEARIAYPTTGGLCFVPSGADGIQTAVLEVIERDAINLCWTSGVRAVRLENSARSSRYRVIRRGSSVLAFIPWTDVPYVRIVHAQYYDPEGPLFLAGGGVARSTWQATGKALLEIKQCAHATQYLRGLDVPIARGGVRDFFDVIPFYSDRRRMAVLRERMEEVLIGDVVELQGPGRAEGASRRSTFSDKEWSDVLGSIGPVYALEMDVGDLGVPGSVIRCVVPGITMAGVPNLPFLGHDRYYAARQLADGMDRPSEFRDLHLELVPFP